MQVTVGLSNGKVISSDAATDEEIIEDAGSVEAATDLIDSLFRETKNIRDLKNFGLEVEGLNVFFNPDHIMYIAIDRGGL